MPKTYPDDLAEWVKGRQAKKPRQDKQVAFLAVKSDVQAALDAGYAMKTIWEHMQEKGRLRCRYETFTQHVKRYIRDAQLAAPADGLTPGQHEEGDEAKAEAETGSPASPSTRNRIKKSFCKPPKVRIGRQGERPGSAPQVSIEWWQVGGPGPAVIAISGDAGLAGRGGGWPAPQVSMNGGRFRPREASNRTLWTIQCILDAVSEPTAAEMGNGNGAFRHAHDQEPRSRCPPSINTAPAFVDT